MEDISFDAACKRIAMEASDFNADDVIAHALGLIIQSVAKKSRAYPSEYNDLYGSHGAEVWEWQQVAVGQNLISDPADEEEPDDKARRLKRCLEWLSENITQMGS
jgi:hypothetical protein